jgi:hypothetical protein
MCGQEGFFGTSCFQVVLDIEEMSKLEASVPFEKEEDQEIIDDFFGAQENPDDKCSTTKLSITNNVISIKPTDLGDVNDYNPGF